jgi:predicted SAM-dependent methyltransferase
MQFKRVLRAIGRRIPIVRRYQIHRHPSTFDGKKAFLQTQHVRPRNLRGLSRVHYACGRHFFPDWLNVDSYRQGNPQNAVFECVNLVSRHPFPDDVFEYGFAEDFLEHLSQVDSLLFLSECHRTLKQGGVLRLAFPGLEGVLNKHYLRSDWETVNLAKEEAYMRYEHVHFYSREELSLVARHFGFRDVTFCTYGESSHPALQGLERRAAQQTLNTYAELTK